MRRSHRARAKIRWRRPDGSGGAARRETRSGKSPPWPAISRVNSKVAEAPESARIVLTADDHFRLKLNGSEIGRSSGEDAWRQPKTIDIKGKLRRGANKVEIEVSNVKPSPCGLIAAVEIKARERQDEHDHHRQGLEIRRTRPEDVRPRRVSSEPTASSRGRRSACRGWCCRRSSICASPSPLPRRSGGPCSTPPPSASTRSASTASGWATTTSPPAGPTTPSASTTAPTR